jgi:LmbE family N-acetylglucosaminyl deacetylase
MSTFQPINSSATAAAQSTAPWALSPFQQVVERPYWTFQDIGQLPAADVLVTLAHPDDETLLSGTLRQLHNQGRSIQVVYVTDGKAGRDVSGRGLSGDMLGHARRMEVVQSLQSLGITRKPLVLDFMDGQIERYPAPIQEQLRTILLQTRPQLVLTFRKEDGITNHPDHKAIGAYTDQLIQALRQTQTPRDQADARALGVLPQVFHIAMSETGCQAFHSAFPPGDSSWKDMTSVPDQSLDVWVRLSESDRLHKQRALESHASQFPDTDKRGFWLYAQRFPFETFQSLLTSNTTLPTNG